MSNQRHEGIAVHPHALDTLTWPILLTAPAVWPVMPWFQALWEYAPTPTALYMGISAAFMLFQMFDKLGLLERFKRRELQDAPDDPPEHK